MDNLAWISNRTWIRADMHLFITLELPVIVLMYLCTAQVSANFFRTFCIVAKKQWQLQDMKTSSQ